MSDVVLSVTEGNWIAKLYFISKDMYILVTPDSYQNGCLRKRRYYSTLYSILCFPPYWSFCQRYEKTTVPVAYPLYVQKILGNNCSSISCTVRKLRLRYSWNLAFVLGLFSVGHCNDLVKIGSVNCAVSPIVQLVIEKRVFCKLTLDLSVPSS